MSLPSFENPSTLGRLAESGGGCREGSGCSGQHFVQFYEKDDAMVGSLGEFAKNGFDAGEAIVVLATREHRCALADWLREHGANVDLLRASDAYIELDAADMLARIMAGASPDPAGFAEAVEPLIARASAGGRPVRAFGELVALLTERGNPSAAIRLEELWNELGRRHSFSLFCAYPMRCFAGAGGKDSLRQVCGTHDRVIPAESYSEEGSRHERAMAVTFLQQKTASLDAEISLRRSAEESLRSKEAVTSALESFAYSISHDLRAPLRTIRSFSQILTEQHSREVSAEAADYLQRIAAASEGMHHFIQEVLENSRRAASEISVERVDLDPLIKDVIDRCPNLQPPHASIVVEQPLPAVLANPSALSQCFSNLLENAVKFVAPQRHPEIRISTEVLEEPCDDSESKKSPIRRVRIRIRDNGIGLPADEGVNIFGLFERARTDYEGTGIGLATVKQAAEQMGGRVGCRSNQGGGSTFWLDLKVSRK